jgi:riboflavin synthase
MFTGIVEEIGTIENSSIRTTDSVIDVSARTVLEGTRVGDSIAVNGVCLTVKRLGKGASFFAEILTETLNKTTLGRLKMGTQVNLERAMTPSGRFGGHIVTGHIDGVGAITKKQQEGADIVIGVKCGADLLKYIVQKGSVALNGVSLTVTDVSDDGFEVHLTGYTLEHSTFLRAKVHDELNIETDIIGKYVEKMAGLQARKGVTEVKLREEGYL